MALIMHVTSPSVATLSDNTDDTYEVILSEYDISRRQGGNRGLYRTMVSVKSPYNFKFKQKADSNSSDQVIQVILFIDSFLIILFLYSSKWADG